jgi:hypothetical protein
MPAIANLVECRTYVRLRNLRSLKLRRVENAPGTPGRRVSRNLLPANGSWRRHAQRDKTRNATPLIVGPKLFIKLGPKPLREALERERPQIVNNFAPRRVSRHELTPPPSLVRINGEFRAADRPGVQNNTQTMTRVLLWYSYVSL